MTAAFPILTAGIAVTATALFAQTGPCRIEAGRVALLSNDFPALRSVADRAQECFEGGGATFERNQTTEHRDLQVAALKADPAQYTAAIVANSSIVPLLNEGLVRPLDDLIAEYGAGIADNRKIVVNGKVMAIAFMANAQHLFYRSDILEQAGVAVPTSYEEVIAAAQAIEDAGLLAHPYAMNSEVGWNLGEEFVNIYLGMGGEFFVPGTAEPAIDNPTGVAALEMLRDLNAHAGPDFLTYDENTTAALWESGELALGTFWGSRAAALLDDEGSTPEVIAATRLVAAPTAGGGTAPSSTLWWDGFTIAANITDEDAAATFRALVHATDAGLMETANDEAVWLVEGYAPSPAAEGVAATAAAGAAPYPMLPYMGLLHIAIGTEITGFLQGTETAGQALADIEATYRTGAAEQGFLK